MCTPIHPLIHEVEPKIQNDNLHLCSFMFFYYVHICRVAPSKFWEMIQEAFSFGTQILKICNDTHWQKW